MVERVDSTKIESIVGVERRIAEHWARAVSDEQVVYILHSKRCLDQDEAGIRDLRDCPYSAALAQGIDADEWVPDEAVRVMVSYGRLVPYVYPKEAESGGEGER